MISSDCRIRTTCRLCDGALRLGLSLVPTPPANELVSQAFVDSGKTQDVFPLDVMVCETCAHVQLSAVVNPERLFRNYPYRSGASQQFVEHLQAYANSLQSMLPTWRTPFVVEIGSNDGTLLRQLSGWGCHVLGVDPAEIPGLIDFHIIRDFFTPSVAHRIRSEFGRADMVLANHVFAHADDLRGIVQGVRDLLTEDGIFVFEVGYLADVIEKRLFDVCYHEHTSFHHVHPLVGFFDRLGMTLFDVQRVDTQGGAIRCFVRGKTGPIDVSLLSEEKRFDFDTPDGIEAALFWLNKEIQRAKEGLLRLLSELTPEGQSIAAYGAPAKATTFLHQFGIGRDVIDFVVDDSTLKQGFYLPGKQIPILPTSALYERNPHYCLILAWNFVEQIMRNNKEYKGKWIVPLPELRVVG